MNTLEIANEARLNKSPNEKFRFDGEITSFKEMIDNDLFVSKKTSIQTHASKKRNCEYKELASPKTIYELIMRNGNMLDCSKIVFDSLTFA